MKNWGYLVLAAAVLLLFVREIGPQFAVAAFALSGFWLLFGVGTWCGAKVRAADGLCRNNSFGLLGGCHIRQHRWQRLKALLTFQKFRETCRGWFTGAPQQIATCSLVASAVGTLFGLVQIMLAVALA
ncbi:hypothetical protein Pen01_47670 [Phytomonospora endophytica]|nr:hypothetical protein Pen01_47670 [Phytomonospora endophytica]